MLRPTKKTSLILCALLVATTAPALADNSVNTSLSSFLSGSTSNSAATPTSTTGYRGAQQLDATRASIAYASDDASNAARIDSTNNQNCTAVKQSASEWKTVSVQRSVAPSPQSVIRDTTCFVDVIAIKIPRTGYGMLDSLMPDLIKFASSALCNSTTGFWSNIAKLASSGTVAGLLGNAVNAGTKYVSQSVANVTSTAFAPKNHNIVSSVVVRMPNGAVPPPTGNSNYGMCGDVALFTEDVSSKYSQHAGSRAVTQYTQSTMSRGVGYSLSFTTGQDTASLDNGITDQDPEFFVSTIAARITNPSTRDVNQLMVISSRSCDFEGDQGLGSAGAEPSVQFVVSTGHNAPDYVRHLAPNTTYYINYIDRVNDQMTCPPGSSCDFEIDFYNTNPVPVQIDKLLR